MLEFATGRRSRGTLGAMKCVLFTLDSSKPRIDACKATNFDRVLIDFRFFLHILHHGLYQVFSVVFERSQLFHWQP